MNRQWYVSTIIENGEQKRAYLSGNAERLCADDFGYVWYWDGVKVYAPVLVEPERFVSNEELNQNGYYAATEYAAYERLYEGGYI